MHLFMQPCGGHNNELITIHDAQHNLYHALVRNIVLSKPSDCDNCCGELDNATKGVPCSDTRYWVLTSFLSSSRSTNHKIVCFCKIGVVGPLTFLKQTELTGGGCQGDTNLQIWSDDRALKVQEAISTACTHNALLSGIDSCV